MCTFQDKVMENIWLANKSLACGESIIETNAVTIETKIAVFLGLWTYLSAGAAFAHYEGLGDYPALGKTAGPSTSAVNPRATNANSSNQGRGRQCKTVSSPWDLLNSLLIADAWAATARVNVRVEGAYRYVFANGIPDHSTGAFPNRGNPNSISEQDYHFRMPVQGQLTGTTSRLFMSPFGVAVNGVPFDPGAEEFWRGDRNSGWQYEAMYLGARLGLDSNNAHVQPNGAYHYHGSPTALLQKLGRFDRPILLGYAADGFPIYGPFGYADADSASGGLVKLCSSYRLKSGSRPGGSSGGSFGGRANGGSLRGDIGSGYSGRLNPAFPEQPQSGPGGTYDGAFVQDYEYIAGLGQLDDCNGRTGVTPEYPHGTYYYVITDTFPFIPRAYKGTPDPSFQRRGPGPRPGPGSGQSMGPGAGRAAGGRRPPPFPPGGPPPW